MRIAMVSEHASPLAVLGGPDAGGQNVYVARLAAALAERGHDVVVHTRRDAPGLPERQVLAPGVTVHHVPAGPPEPVPKDALLPHMPLFAARLSGVWAEERPDVVHAHYWMSGLAALDGAAAQGIPVVQTYHALGTVKRRHQGARDTSPGERTDVERHIGRTCSAVLATCAEEAGELDAMGVPLHHVSVVPCGVDTRHFTPEGRTPERARRRRLLAVGRLVPRKGFDQAIRALPQLPNTELYIAGGPGPELLDTDPEAQRLRQLARTCGVLDRVRLLGGVPYEAMPELYRTADLVVSTPRYEPFGMVPLEAMASAVPVVATRVGGQQETVRDGVTGRLVEPQNPRLLARVLRELLDDPAVLRTYGEAGRQRVLDRYTWQHVAEGAERTYEHAVAGTRPGAEVLASAGEFARVPQGPQGQDPEPSGAVG